MEIERRYINQAERLDIDTDMTRQGYRMLHDHFDADVTPDKEPHGIMTYTDVPCPTASTATTRDYGKEIDTLSVRLAKVEAVRV